MMGSVMKAFRWGRTGRSGTRAVAGPARRRWLLDSSRCAALLLAGPWLSSRAQGAKAAADAPVILVLGDSLSAEYGLPRGTGWVALLSQRLAERKIEAQVVNASISGDTTSGGVTRLGPLLKLHQPAIVIIELGANDALRGLPLKMTQANLATLVRQARKAGAKVVLVGIQVPPNYGQAYTRDFAAVFPAVAHSEGAALVPFLLAGVADAPNADDLFQADRIHPIAQAHPTILANIWRVLEPLLKGLQKGPAAPRR
jgi:acyl-CoA thioesterase-1